MAELLLLKRKRSYIQGQVSRIEVFLNQEEDFEEIDEEAVKGRLDKLEGLASRYDDLQSDIEDQGGIDEGEEAEERNTFEERYYRLTSKCRRLIKRAQDKRQPSDTEAKLENSIKVLADNQAVFGALLERLTSLNVAPIEAGSTSGNIHTNSPSCRVKLPTTPLPSFSGNYVDWIAFRDLFISLIGEHPELSPAQKLHYLKGALKGEAASLLKHIPISDANYTVAWDNLKGRYDKDKFIIEAHIRTIMELPTIRETSLHNIKQLLGGMQESVNALGALKVPVDKWDYWLVYVGASKLEAESKQLWARNTAKVDKPTFKEFCEFLMTRICELEVIGANKGSGRQTERRKHIHTLSVSSCPSCQQGHFLEDCERFKQLCVETRRKFVAENNLCYICLKGYHTARKCRNKLCRICNRRHHHLLHQEVVCETARKEVEREPYQRQRQKEAPPTSKPSSNAVNSFVASQERGQVLLPTAVILVPDSSNVLQPCRALLDSGSQTTLITEECTQRLGLKRSCARIPIHGLDSTKAKISRGAVRLTLYSRFTSESAEVRALILSNITGNMPAYTIALPPPSNIDLADPSYFRSGPIDILIGADIFFSCLKDGQIELDKCSKLVMQNTIFGWAVGGRHFDKSTDALITLHTHIGVDDLLRRFWELEEPETLINEAVEDKQIEEHFQKTHKRTEGGRYVVKLPFKSEIIITGKSLKAARSRLASLERKFKCNSELKEAYVDFMEEYIRLGHMKERGVLDEESLSEGIFLPHHAVFKAESTTTKTRVVFDASAKTSNGMSLNDMLLKGPVIQPELIALLVKFRLHKIGLTADITKMYRQILVNEEDRKYQQIIWRTDPMERVSIYQLLTITYGTSSAPFQATRVLQQLAHDEGERFPKAKMLLIKNFYMDDFIGGADSIEEATQITEELTSLLALGGFELRKWVSNAEEVVEELPSTLTEHSVSFDENPHQVMKTLGLHWLAAKDVFCFKVNLGSQTQHTKRSMLSEVSRIFDPLGWLSPCIVTAKIMFQSLWLANLDWDMPLPMPLLREWEEYRSALPELEKIEIPRSVCSSKDKLEIFGFADASEKAYAAVLYLRATSLCGQNETYHICSKTKVAPLNQISLPRLELCAAHLLAKLITKFKDLLGIELSNCYPHTDSTIVLSWLAQPPRKWKTYIANRTSDILRMLPQVKWRHIKSTRNPADCASRGISVRELLNHHLWWKGPDMPSTEDMIKDKQEVDMEQKLEIRCHIIRDEVEISELFRRYSSLKRLLRISAICRRFLQLKKNKRAVTYRILEAEEIEEANIGLIRKAQEEGLHEGVTRLKQGIPLPLSNRLSMLKVFLDDNHILRVGGRLRAAELEYSEKHPVILHASHPFTSLVVDDIHREAKHAGPQLMEAIISQRYHIIGGRRLIKKIVRRCVICTRYRARILEQHMGDLPSYRVRPSRPFCNTGVDYAGPLHVRAWKGRGGKTYKAYIALFICMCTKAIHLELVSELTTEAFIAALKRFVSRRGYPSHMFSDNATNFVGAKRELAELQLLLKDDEHHDKVANYLSTQRCEWHFIPPAAPHFGGLWESGVKALKFHLYREMGEAQLTFEELLTLLCQIEACLNSRPLCPRNIQDGNIEALTPAHFLIGDSLLMVPDRDYTSDKIGSLTRWKYLQRIQQSFWRRWQSEYLSNLQTRYKWKREHPNIQPGQVVILREDNLPPGRWSLGIVQEVHPGNDGLVRVVTVKSRGCILKRPLAKLVPLYEETD